MGMRYSYPQKPTITPREVWDSIVEGITVEGLKLMSSCKKANYANYANYATLSIKWVQLIQLVQTVQTVLEPTR
ncbi:hypothetical protein VN97_g12782 [Penicillium thymicola]|uniref:Uncharacterized protein n=1 Tax=Penicillium thymicola TaxID=293382 RepID=A0AAI9X1Y9_PENTH|nr:hypothetical protein VN97_g12782 [Penicillium thymicola]